MASADDAALVVEFLPEPEFEARPADWKPETPDDKLVAVAATVATALVASVPLADAGPVAVGVPGPPDVNAIWASTLRAVGAGIEIVRVPATHWTAFG